MSNGYILYEGPSQIDGEPIVLIATGFKNKSANPKTGDMVQTYILRQDVPPLQAIKSGLDKSICGSCKHRGVFGKRRSCYVQVQQAPTAIYNAYKRGSYDRALTSHKRNTLFIDRKIRLGAYGDPAAIPFDIWKSVLNNADHWTGYTHMWKEKKFQVLQTMCMASVDTEAEYNEAKQNNWRTFRVKNSDDKKFNHEATCPATLGQTDCATCTQCDGNIPQLRELWRTEKTTKKDIVLDVHGAKYKIDEFKSVTT